MSTYIIAAVMVIIAIILKQPQVKGWIGEKGVSRRLNKLDPMVYHVYNDVTLPSGNGRTTQIDHIVVSKYGIFVIETKNYKGWIMGKEHQEYWTQVIYKSKKRMPNPLRQNYGHVKALIANLGNEELEPHIFPIVCFSARATLKVELVKPSTHLIYFNQILAAISRYKEVILDEDELHHIHETIRNHSLKGKDTKKAHVANVKSNLIDKELQVANNICPRCNSALQLRQGKYGRFKGCTNYPTCKFTYKLIDSKS